MKEYIEREAALKNQRWNGRLDEYVVFVRDIVSIPVADVVEVVRCRECKWYDRKTSECHNPRYGNGWANYPPPSVNDDYYCADGERKDGADDETL